MRKKLRAEIAIKSNNQESKNSYKIEIKKFKFSCNYVK